MPRTAPLALAALLLSAGLAHAQVGTPPASKLPKKFALLADVNVELIPAKVKRGQTASIRLTIDLSPGKDRNVHTYPFFPKDTEQKATNKFALPLGDLTLLDAKGVDPQDGIVKKQREGAEAGVLDEQYIKTTTWEFKVQVSPTAKPGLKDIDLGKTRIQACGRTQDDESEQCVNAFAEHLPHLIFEITDDPAVVAVQPDPPAPPPAAGIRNSDKPLVVAVPATADPTGPKIPKPGELYAADIDTIRAAVVKDESRSGATGSSPDSGLGAFVVTAALWGLISLVTPCVFPMIPITVSIFLKHAHGSFGERMKLAGAYCLTIIVVLGLSAFALLKFMAWLSAHPVTNVVLGLLFLVLALSLFGMYEITLPNFLSRRLQAKQAKGGVIGTVFGALAFTVISFTCVAPFLGGFAGISAADSGSTSLIAVPTTKEILGGLAFATAFAAPFFVLAMVPGLLKSLPKSGGWLDSVKVVMGFLELAAALKFFRTAELRVFSPAEFFTYDMVIAGWVGISFACALYLLNVYRLPHDEEKPNIGVPRLLFALIFIGLGFYLLPALFKDANRKPQRPAGTVYAWVQAFLLPETEPWPTDLKDAIDRARKSGKPVLIDFTGKTCTNCKYNEESVFTIPSVRTEMDKFEKVQLYTDEVPSEAFASDPGNDARVDEATENRKFQTALFGDIALPLYTVVLPLPDGKVKLISGTFKGKPNSPFEGKINNSNEFAVWLKESLANAKK
jgi:thiol:disulfide interchange protein